MCFSTDSDSIVKSTAIMNLKYKIQRKEWVHSVMVASRQDAKACCFGSVRYSTNTLFPKLFKQNLWHLS